MYDHGARNRNPISTLWYGIDPLFEKYPDFSPYNYCTGNPVRFIDPDGRKFTEKLEKKVREYESFLDRGIYKYQNLLNSSKLKNYKRIAYTKYKNNLLDAKEEISVLRNSSQLYDYTEKKDYCNSSLSNLNIISPSSDGTTFFNEQTYAVTINVEDGNIIVFSHEMKHAYQFEIGELTLRGNNNAPGLTALYDITDEIAAYERQSSFSGVNTTYKTSGGNYDILASKRPQSIRIEQNKSESYYRRLSETSLKNQVFRVSGKTYYKK